MGPPQEARQQRVVSLREERSESHPSELSDIAEAFVNERRESNERSAIVADAVLSISAALGTITRDVREVALRQEAADLKMDRVERSMAVLAEKIDLLIAEFDEARGSLAAELGHRATNERHALKDVEQTQKDLMAVKEEFDDTRGSVAAELGHRATNEKHMLEDVETTKTDLKAVKEELGGLRAIVANPRVQGGLFTAGLGVFGLVIKLAIDAWLGSKGIK